MTPLWVRRILQSDLLWHFCRILGTFMYWFAGAGFLLDFGSAQATMSAFGLEPVWLIAALTIAVQLIGSALIIFDKAVWFGAGMLSVFTLSTIPTAHAFWNMEGLAAVQAKLESEEHLTVIGGLIGLAILSQIRAEWKTGRRLP
jgi:transmembrane protein